MGKPWRMQRSLQICPDSGDLCLTKCKCRCAGLSETYSHFVLAHFQYCNSLFVDIGRTLNKKLEDANYYGLRTIMNTRKRINYESVLRMVDTHTLKHRCIEQSLTIFFKCFKENGPCYIANLFKPRVTSYHLRSRGLNVEQNSYNSRFFHGSYTYVISCIWNQLPLVLKKAPTVLCKSNENEFRALFSSKYRWTFDRYFAVFARHVNGISATIRQG